MAKPRFRIDIHREGVAIEVKIHVADGHGSLRTEESHKRAKVNPGEKVVLERK